MVELARDARQRLAALGYENVRVVEGDSTLGFAEEAPYDAILTAASGPDVPESLVAQLAPGGRLVMPLGAPGEVQHLVTITRNQDGSLARRDLGAVRFVPLIGAEGWREGS